jgi:hypothetical protein
MKIFANIQTKEGHEVKHLNRRKAIRERCLNCSAWIFSEVRQCPMTDCALYPFRMGTGRQDAKERNRAIRQYCLWCCCEQPLEVSQCPAIDCPLYYFRNSIAIKEYRAMLKTDDPGVYAKAGYYLDCPN